MSRNSILPSVIPIPLDYTQLVSEVYVEGGGSLLLLF